MNDEVARATGRRVDTIGGVRAFLPNDLPESIAISPHLAAALANASTVLGGLRGLATSSLLSSLHGPLLRREANANAIERELPPGPFRSLGELLGIYRHVYVDAPRRVSVDADWGHRIVCFLEIVAQ